MKCLLLYILVLLMLTTLTVGQSGNLIANPSFENDLNSDLVPDGWSAKHFTTSDGVICGDGSYQATGSCSLKLTGNGKTKSIKQTVSLNVDDLGGYKSSFVVTPIDVVGGSISLTLKMFNDGVLVNEAAVVSPLKTAGPSAYHLQISSFNDEVDEFKVTIKFSAASGAVYLDEVWLADTIPVQP